MHLNNNNIASDTTATQPAGGIGNYDFLIEQAEAAEKDRDFNRAVELSKAAIAVKERAEMDKWAYMKHSEGKND